MSVSAKPSTNDLNIWSKVAVVTLFCSLTLVLSAPALAQTFSVIHTFTGALDGFQPYAGVTIDQAGNLYGTTTEDHRGSIYQMKRRNGVWTFATLYQFGYNDFMPQGRVVAGPGGALYGLTTYGGTGNCYEGCGMVYAIRPPQTICRTSGCPWSLSSAYSFDYPVGIEPQLVDPVFDTAGNMYGTTLWGGIHAFGAVFQLSRSNGTWTANNIYDFGGIDGKFPLSGVTLDAQGNVYGTTSNGGPDLGDRGIVYSLTRSGASWNFALLHSFHAAPGEAYSPIGGVIFDQAGNLYGTTRDGGRPGQGGVVFELSPAGGTWNFTILHSFSGNGGPMNTLAMDATGNLYGTTYADGAFGFGSVFKLTFNNGNWTFTDLHDFTNGEDGGNPIGAVSLDANGNLYGTTSGGGSNNNGVVWEIAF